MATNPTTTLMERVIRASGSLYLSDLHDRQHADDVGRAVLDIPEGEYPAEAWVELADYVMDGRRAFSGRESARETLLRYLGEIE